MTHSLVPEPKLDGLQDVFRSLRTAEFQWTGETTYLNNASIGPIPERTRRVIDEFTAKRTAPHLCPERDLLASLGEVRELLARLINAETGEIGLATNTSFGLGLAAGALPLRDGDIVLLSDREFPANVYPWLQLRSRGIRVELVPTTPMGWPDEDQLVERLEDPRVRALAISFVQFSSGFRSDLDRLGTACRESGSFLVVDAIQGVGHVPLDVRRTPIDILACGGQKWLLSPWGSGFVYVRRELLPNLEPVLAGWMAFEGNDDFSRLTDYDAEFRPDARRYELGTLPFQDFVGMAESVRMLLDLKVERISAYTRLVREPVFKAALDGQIRVVSPTDPGHDSSIICVATDRVVESYHALEKARVVCALREGAIRLSPHCYNTVEETGKVVGILTRK